MISITSPKPYQQRVSSAALLSLLPLLQHQPWLFKPIPHVLQDILHVVLNAGQAS